MESFLEKFDKNKMAGFSYHNYPAIIVCLLKNYFSYIRQLSILSPEMGFNTSCKSS